MISPRTPPARRDAGCAFARAGLGDSYPALSGLGPKAVKRYSHRKRKCWSWAWAAVLSGTATVKRRGGNGSVMNEIVQLDTLLDAGHRFILFEETDVGALLELFEHLDRSTGKASYQWLPEQGLRRLTAEFIPIPETSRLSDALDYIHDRRQYGVFLLPELGKELKQPDIVKRIEAIATNETEPRRVLVLYGGNLHLPNRLRGLAVQISRAALTSGA